MRNPGKNHKYLSKFHIDTDEGQDRLYRILTLLDGLPMQVSGSKREFVNEAVARLNRLRNGVESGTQAAAPPGTAPAGPDLDPGGQDFDMENVRWEA